MDKSTLKKMKVRVNEIYNTLDKDQSRNLTLDEFIRAIGISKENNPVVYEELRQA